MVPNYGVGEIVWMHPPVHRILGWASRPSNFNLKRNVWRLNQIKQIIDDDIFVKGDPAISDLATLNRFPSLFNANLINSTGSKIGIIADFIFEFKTGNIKFYLVSRVNPKIPGSSRWKLNIQDITDQQPGLVFCNFKTINDLPLIKSSLKNQFFEKSQKIFNRLDDMKNKASTKLEDWLEDDEDINPVISNLEEDFFDSEIPLNEDKKFNSDNINLKSSNKKKEEDPWI
tara:strand:- start:272 stop:958 length:687 start_codon:yes stop_codon:yes gene_type:complete